MGAWRWTATTSDGHTWSEDDPALRDPKLSPWRALEQAAQRLGATITSAAQVGPTYSFGLDAQGHPLECGKAYHVHLGMAGEPQRQVEFRFVCRLEPTRRVWAITHPVSGAVWGMEGPPDVAMCPDPLAVS